MDFWSERPSIDWVFSVALTGVHVAIVERTHHTDLIAWPDLSQRIAGYTAAAGVIALVAGLSAIAISQYSASNGERVQWLKERKGAVLNRSWLGILVVPLVSAFLCLLMIFLDSEKTVGWVRFLFEGAVLLVTARFVRLTWLFSQFMEAARLDEVSDTRPLPGQVGQVDWLARRRASGS